MLTKSSPSCGLPVWFACHPSHSWVSFSQFGKLVSIRRFIFLGCILIPRVKPPLHFTHANTTMELGGRLITVVYCKFAEMWTGRKTTEVISCRAAHTLELQWTLSLFCSRNKRVQKDTEFLAGVVNYVFECNVQSLISFIQHFNPSASLLISRGRSPNPKTLSIPNPLMLLITTLSGTFDLRWSGKRMYDALMSILVIKKRNWLSSFV